MVEFHEDNLVERVLLNFQDQMMVYHLNSYLLLVVVLIVEEGSLMPL